MLTAEKFVNKLLQVGFDIFTGVPCSIISESINFLENLRSQCYVPLNNEGEAVAFACGASLAGKLPVVMMQNSGLGNALNPLTSLVHPFQFPLLIICTWRGNPELNDEPQHELIGTVTMPILDLIKIKNKVVQPENFESNIDDAIISIKKFNAPYALILKAGTIKQSLHEKEKIINTHKYDIKANSHFDISEKFNKPLPRFDVLKKIADIVGAEHIVISTTGHTSRELFAYRDSDNHFYMVGSMGCVSSLGLGLAMSRRNKKVIAIDGDGAALMRLEAFVSVGHYHPKNFIHILLDNNAHDSTGGQNTLSETVSFCAIANACGYEKIFYANDLLDLEFKLTAALQSDGPAFIYMRISQGSIVNLPRPTIKPQEVKQRLINFINKV